MQKGIRKLMLVFLGIPSAVLIVILIYPLLYSLYISFFDYNMLENTSATYVGLKNYVEVLTSSEFWQSFGITVVFVVGSVGFQIILGFALALLLFKNFRMANILRSAFLLPYVIPATTVGIMWRWLLNADYGIWRWICDLLNIETFSILGDSSLAIFGIIFADIWHMTPLVFLLLLGGLQSISTSLLEAAEIDGAGVLQRFMYVIFPLMRKVVTVTMVYRIIGAVRTFDKILAMTQGGPGESTQILSWLIYSTGFRSYDFGKASAMSYIVLIIIIVLCSIYIKLQSEKD